MFRSIPFDMDRFDGLGSKEYGKGHERSLDQMGGQILLDFDFADDLRILGENIIKMNNFLKVLRTWDERIGLKIHVQKSRSFSMGISEEGEMILGNEKIDQVDSFIYLGISVSKNGGCCGDGKSGTADVQGVFHS